MNSDAKKCPHCGQKMDKNNRSDVKVSRYVIKGAVIGLIIGAIFDNFYFYIGVVTDFFTFMPIVHLIAGLLLGMLAGWVIGERKKL